MHEEPLRTRKALGILNAVAYCFHLFGAHRVYVLNAKHPDEASGGTSRCTAEPWKQQGAPEALPLLPPLPLELPPPSLL